MSTNKEHGLASHSSNMVAPREFTTEDNGEWTVVQSKRALRKIRKLKKIKDLEASKKNKIPKSFFNDSSSDSSISLSTVKSGTSWPTSKLMMTSPQLGHQFLTRSIQTRIPKLHNQSRSSIQRK